MAELLADQDNGWVGTVCQDLDKWIVTAWRKVYNFLIWGKGMATRMEKFVDGKIKNPVSPKDRYVILDRKDVKARRVLEFLVPILYPEKPTRITITIGNTIFGALSKAKEVDWVPIIQDTI